MSDYNIGYNFDSDLAFELQQLNQIYNHRQDSKITSVFGSTREHAWLSARPDFRLPNVEFGELEDHVSELKAYGIDFNYTMNAPYLGSKQEFKGRENEIFELAEDLEAIGVRRFIISNPMLLDFFVKKMPRLDVAFELSTIMHIDTPMQIQAFKQMDDRIDRVVGNILYNRDFRKLQGFVDVCQMLEIDYEIMVNEFCMITSGKEEVPIAAHCIHRDACYQCHSENKTKVDAKLLGNYPMSKCMSSRAHNPADWLRAGWILPQHIKHYNEIGITNFKITGRTAKTPYIRSVAIAYLTEQFDGNLLELWKPLETIYSEKDELTEHRQKHFIPAFALDNFLAPWVDGDIDCNNTLCQNCLYCDNWYEGIVRNGAAAIDSNK